MLTKKMCRGNQAFDSSAKEKENEVADVRILHILQGH